MKALVFSISLLLLFGVVACSQDRLTDEMKQQAKEVQDKLDSDGAPVPSDTNVTPVAAAPKEAEPTTDKPQRDIFKVVFDTTKGPFTVEVHRDWSPNGVKRFEELVRSGFYDGNRFFRVLPNFVVQWGLSGDPIQDMTWMEQPIKDDPVKQPNREGMMVFAKSQMKDSRTTQIFINLRDNSSQLDATGFAPFAKVIDGMDVVKSLYSGYGESPDQGRIMREGTAYLTGKFPELDYIKSAVIVE